MDPGVRWSDVSLGGVPLRCLVMEVWGVTSKF